MNVTSRSKNLHLRDVLVLRETFERLCLKMVKHKSPEGRMEAENHQGCCFHLPLQRRSSGQTPVGKKKVHFSSFRQKVGSLQRLMGPL